MPRPPIDENAMSGTLLNNEPLLLNRVQVAAQMAIGPQFAHDTRINVVSDMVRDHLIAQMTSFVLTEHLANDVYSETKQVPASAFQHFKLDYSWRWTVWYLAWFCWIVRHIAARWPVRYDTLTFTVHVERRNSFPYNSYVPAEPFGRPVRFDNIHRTRSWDTA